MFPVMLDLDQDAVVVVGGGEIGYHKVINLLRFGLKPTIISKDFDPRFIQLEAADEVKLLRKAVEWVDVRDAMLLVLVTSDETINDRFAHWAKRSDKIVVHASNPALGNAQIPATLQRGKLIISVSTSGASPTLAKQIRNDLAEEYDEAYEGYLDFLAEVRVLVKRVFTERAERLKWLRLAASDLYLYEVDKRSVLLEKITKG